MNEQYSHTQQGEFSLDSLLQGVPLVDQDETMPCDKDVERDLVKENERSKRFAAPVTESDFLEKI